MRIDYVAFPERADRSRYIAHTFSSYLNGRVLDVGCDKAVLRGLLPSISYTGIDVGGNPDIHVDLEKTERLPFEDGAFDVTVCSDVLEHLDGLHRVFGELVRVTKGYLVISLPNNWANARRPIERGKGSIAHYGLPATRPIDRHKWFFGLSEAIAFFKAQEQLLSVSIVQLIVNEKPRNALVRVFRHMRYPQAERYMNRYAHTVWAVYKRQRS